MPIRTSYRASIAVIADSQEAVAATRSEIAPTRREETYCGYRELVLANLQLAIAHSQTETGRSSSATEARAGFNLVQVRRTSVSGSRLDRGKKRMECNSLGRGRDFG